MGNLNNHIGVPLTLLRLTPDDELAVVADMLRDAGFKRVIIADEGCMIGLHSAKGALGIHFIVD